MKLQKSIVIAVVAVAITASLIGGVWYWQKTNWKVYRNEKFGYELNYPPHYEYRDFTENTVKAYYKSGRAFPLPESSVISFGKNLSPDYLINPQNTGQEHKMNISVYKGHIGAEDFYDDMKNNAQANYIIGGLNALRKETKADQEGKLKRLEILFWKDSLTFFITIPPNSYMNAKDMKFIERIIASIRFIGNNH